MKTKKVPTVISPDLAIAMPENSTITVCTMAVGITVVGVGIVIGAQSETGSNPYDGFILALSEKVGKPYRIMKTVAQSIRTERKGVQVFGATTVLAGAPDIELSLLGIRLALAPESFFQLNVPQARELYQMAVAKIDPCDTLAEAYCGVGAMSLLAAGKAKQVIGFESIPEAVSNAAANADRNHIGNARFVCADAAEGLKSLLAEQKVDALLADPPRSGMAASLLPCAPPAPRTGCAGGC